MIEVLKPEDIISYKILIDDCFGSNNDLEQYKKYQKNNAYTIWVVKDKNEVVASATQYSIDLFTFVFQPSLMIFNVATRADYRRKNIARDLLEHIIENAKAAGYNSISLTCLDNAYPAHKLYESVGFKKAGSVKYDLYF